jgi:hypothetical protein
LLLLLLLLLLPLVLICRRARIGPHHFLGSTGYGHGDLGREALDQVGLLTMLLCQFLAFYHFVTHLVWLHIAGSLGREALDKEKACTGAHPVQDRHN